MNDKVMSVKTYEDGISYTKLTTRDYEKLLEDSRFLECLEMCNVVYCDQYNKAVDLMMKRYPEYSYDG